MADADGEVLREQVRNPQEADFMNGAISKITFLLVFLGLLIRDLDNPFGYYEQTSAEDVSLKPLIDAIHRIRTRCNGQAVATV